MYIDGHVLRHRKVHVTQSVSLNHMYRPLAPRPQIPHPLLQPHCSLPAPGEVGLSCASEILAIVWFNFGFQFSSVLFLSIFVLLGVWVGGDFF